MNISWMSRNRATRPLIRYSLCPERYRRRLTTTSPGRATGAGASAAFFLRRGFDSTPAGAPLSESSLAAASAGELTPTLSGSPLKLTAELTPTCPGPVGIRSGRSRVKPTFSALAVSAIGPAISPLSAGPARSEEHTSELQSLAYLVCRLLLEKKKHTS